MANRFDTLTAASAINPDASKAAIPSYPMGIDESVRVDGLRGLGKGLQAAEAGVTNTEQGERIAAGEIITATIEASRLAAYQRAGEISGFEVSVIAKPGQTYVGVGAMERRRLQCPQSAPSDKSIWPLTLYKVNEGFVGVSISRPEGQQNHVPFWAEFNKLDTPAQSSPQPKA